MKNTQRLSSIAVRGYRSIEDAQLELRPLNVLIGANGAGKSNLISFFKMMNEMMTGHLQRYVASTGHATSNLYFGPKVTSRIEADLEFLTMTDAVNTYRLRLAHAARDSLIFVEETLAFQNPEFDEPKVESLGVGHTETLIGVAADRGDSTAGVFRQLLRGCRVFHFHDTGPASRVRNSRYVGDSRWLLPDAGNLAPFLYRLHSKNLRAYRRIVDTIRQVAPFFDDFVLDPAEPGGNDIVLNWRHRKEPDLIFGPHQISDGTLRAICLFSLLMQPEDKLPLLIVIDEPELGLHPYALSTLASLCRSASAHVQILISTQSSTFVNHFDPKDIVVAEYDGRTSRFTRPDAEALEAWLEDYSLGEVWEKNVIGGGPH